MTELTAGMEAPDFTLESDAGTPVSLSALRGNGVVLYFYPKDNTAGCTTEAQGFRDHLADFKALGYEVLGVSRDSVKSHCSFRDKQNLNFPLLSDKEETVCNLYGVLKEKRCTAASVSELSAPHLSLILKAKSFMPCAASKPKRMWASCLNSSSRPD